MEAQELDKKKQDGQFMVLLASIHNNEEKNFVKKLLDVKYPVRDRSGLFWTGGRRHKDGTKVNERHR